MEGGWWLRVSSHLHEVNGDADSDAGEAEEDLGRHQKNPITTMATSGGVVA